MSRAFSSNLVACRHEKGVSQKQAASDLGITSALLSHYENGIRECRIDMVGKIAEYYGVTADYLLGISASRHGAGEVFSMDYMNGDENPDIKTVIRSLINLSQLAENGIAGDENFFCDYFSLCIKKYSDALAGNSDVRARFTTQILDGLSFGGEVSTDIPEPPLCTKTVLLKADEVIDEALSGMMGRR